MVRAREEPVREDVAKIFPTHIAIDAKKNHDAAEWAAGWNGRVCECVRDL